MRRARSPVAAISFIASVRAARGRVTVRASAQLRRRPSPTAARAATKRAARSVCRGRSASARERRTTTNGDPAPGRSGTRRATWLSPPRSSPVVPSPPAAASSAASWLRDSVEAKTRPSFATATWAPVRARRRAAKAASRAKPSVRCPRSSGASPPRSRRIGASTVSRSRPPSSRKGAGSPLQDAASAPRETTGAAPAVGQHEDVRAHAVAVVAGDRLGGARVGLGDRRLELRQVGHERGSLGRELEPRAVVLLDEAGRLGEAPRQLGLRLPRHPPGDEAEGEDGRQHRDRRGGGEDARAEGGEGPRHHSTVKSCSITSTGAITRTSRRDRTCPSFQTARV